MRLRDSCHHLQLAQQALPGIFSSRLSLQFSLQPFNIFVFSDTIAKKICCLVSHYRQKGLRSYFRPYFWGLGPRNGTHTAHILSFQLYMIHENFDHQYLRWSLYESDEVKSVPQLRFHFNILVNFVYDVSFFWSSSIVQKRNCISPLMFILIFKDLPARLCLFWSKATKIRPLFKNPVNYF